MRGAAMMVLLTVLAAGCGSSHEQSASNLAPIQGHYAPSIDPKNFASTIDNRYWPLKPGTGFHYQGFKGAAEQKDDEIVTGKTKRILGIDAVAVRDTVSQHGQPIERTLDYYAQDKQGNVWYMGEDSYELQHGHFVKASDSWLSGVNGAEPGIIMPASPQTGDRYRQEYYPPGKALDKALVLGVRGPFTVPYGTFKHALVTSEFSPLEPQTEVKVYVAGVGEIEEHVVKGGHEGFRLVRITHASAR